MFSFIQVLLLSMKDMNEAKLTSQDLLLFNGIMSDLFPGVDTPINDYGTVRPSNISKFCFLLHYIL